MLSSRGKWVFKDKPPMLFKALAVLVFVNFLAFMVVDETRRFWKTPATSARVSEALSWYAVQGFNLHFVFIASGLVVAFRYRHRLERVPVAKTVGERPATLFDVVAAATMAPAACGFVGSFVAGAIYSQVDRIWGLGIAALAVLAAVWTTDRLIFSFPQSEPFRKRRPAIWIWAVVVSSVVLTLIVSDFGL